MQEEVDDWHGPVSHRCCQVRCKTERVVPVLSVCVCVFVCVSVCAYIYVPKCTHKSHTPHTHTRVRTQHTCTHNHTQSHMCVVFAYTLHTCAQVQTRTHVTRTPRDQTHTQLHNTRKSSTDSTHSSLTYAQTNLPLRAPRAHTMCSAAGRQSPQQERQCGAVTACQTGRPGRAGGPRLGRLTGFSRGLSQARNTTTQKKKRR